MGNNLIIKDMKKYSKILVVFALFYLYSNVCSAQFRQLTHESGLLNLDFEFGDHGEKPDNWSAGNSKISGRIGINRNRKGSYHVSLDSTEKYSGKLSLKMDIDIRNIRRSGYFINMLSIDPITVKTVEFKGWIKTQDIKKGYAGLFFSVQGEMKKRNKTSYFAPTINSYDTRLDGNNDWTQVSIKMDICENAASISFGGRFTGEGTAWFDDLELYINGEKLVDSAQIEQYTQHAVFLEQMVEHRLNAAEK